MAGSSLSSSTARTAAASSWRSPRGSASQLGSTTAVLWTSYVVSGPFIGRHHQAPSVANEPWTNTSRTVTTCHERHEWVMGFALGDMSTGQLGQRTRSFRSLNRPNPPRSIVNAAWEPVSRVADEPAWYWIYGELGFSPSTF